MSRTILHKHHIIPKHAGGTDDPSNLIYLTVEEHAEAHKKLWETYGNEYDRIAWLGLSAMISKQNALFLAMSENGKRNAWHMTKNPKDRAMQRQKSLDMWQIPHMRENLIQKRKEQSATGNNPMQGKKQKRVSCLRCRKEMGCNGIKTHLRYCE